MSRHSAAAVCVMGLVAGLVLTGCATRIRNVPYSPLAKQANGTVARDAAECEAGITGELKGVWFPAEVEFAACMIARNYEVYVQLLDASVDVKKASLRANVPRAKVVNDLVTCERAATRNLTWAEKLGRPLVMAAGVFFMPVSVASMAASAVLAENRQHDYADCMRAMGYVVTPWNALANGHGTGNGNGHGNGRPYRPAGDSSP